MPNRLRNPLADSNIRFGRVRTEKHPQILKARQPKSANTQSLVPLVSCASGPTLEIFELRIARPFTTNLHKPTNDTRQRIRPTLVFVIESIAYKLVRAPINF
jgi:hypothetical protein